MKKFLSLIFVLAMVFSVAACGGKQTYKLGMGVVVSMDSSSEGKGQVDATVVAVVTDKDGKIVAAYLDAVQNKATIGTEISVTNLKTKRELGFDYNMAAFGKPNIEGGTVKEWFEQADAYEAYLVGKTLADVKAFTTQEVNNHQISTDKALLDAGCTMQVTDFNAATVLALTDDQAFTFEAGKDIKLGLAATSENSGSTAATAEANGTLQLYSNFAASVVVDGKIVASLNDAIQPKITFDATGAIVEKTFKNTKRVLKEGYNMAAFGKPNVEGGTVKEWYIQSAAFSKYVVGKTAEQVSKLETQVVNDHNISTDKALLDAGCTMEITGICEVVAKSVNNAH